MKTLDMDHELMAEIRALAAERDHRLGRDMTGTKPLTLVSALAIKKNLQGRPVREGVTPEPAPPEVPVDESPVPEPQPRKMSFLDRMVEPGIYLYEGNVYRVYKSQYNGHTKAKILIKHQRGDGTWERNGWLYAQGMMGKLRPEHEMTAEQSVEFERLYGITVCTRCGAELENDESRARRMGPTCASK